MSKEAAETAQRFCQECLGKEAFLGEPIWFGAFWNVDIEGEPFGYHDLNVVTKAVKGWCEQNNKSFSLNWCGEWKAFVLDRYAASPVPVMARSNDPCHALMAACVQTRREGQGANSEEAA